MSRQEQAKSVQDSLTEVRSAFAAGGLDAVTRVVETTVSKLLAEKAQQQEALFHSKLGQARSGSERGPHEHNATLDFWGGQPPSVATVSPDTDTIAPTAGATNSVTHDGDPDPVDESTGLRASELERQRRRREASEAEIAALKEQLKQAQRAQREAAAQAAGDAERSAGRNRQALQECPVVVVKVPYKPEPFECHCEHCGQPQVIIRSTKREWFEYVPGHYEHHVMELPVTRCSKRCDNSALTTPRPPALLNAGGMIGNSIIAQAVAAKFADRVPVNHQLRMNGRAHLELAESTVRYGYSLGLKTLHETFGESLRSFIDQSSLIQLDPTTFRVLDPEADGGSRRGTVTGFLCDRMTPYMEYHASGSGESVIWNRLRGYTGKVLCDGSNIFDRVFNGVVAEAIAFFCNAHARRKFVPLARCGDESAKFVIESYRQIYRVETLADLQQLSPDERSKLRLERAGPIFDDLHGYLERQCAHRPPSETFSQAARYFLKRVRNLRRYLEDGTVPPDNNAAEELLRCIRLTENASLFAGSDHHAKQHATAWALMKSCVIAKVDPVKWLTDIFGKIADGHSSAKRAELLPAAWKAEQLAVRQ
jgi:transposase